MLHGTNGSLGGKQRYLEDQWAHFRADLRANDGDGWTDMELVGVGNDGDFCSIKVSVWFSLLFVIVIVIVRSTEPWCCPC